MNVISADLVVTSGL
jgi:hypothetical protein